MPWGHCRNTSEFPSGSEWWTGHRWQGPDRHWRAQRWTECGSVSGRLCPPGHQEKTSTTGPAGSTESSRWWKTTQSQYSFLEFSFGLWGCCSLNAANALHWRALGVEQKTEAVRSFLYSVNANARIRLQTMSPVQDGSALILYGERIWDFSSLFIYISDPNTWLR